MTEVRPVRPGRLIFRLVAAIGIGLGASAIWWQYSDSLLAKYGPMIGIEATTPTNTGSTNQ